MPPFSPSQAKSQPPAAALLSTFNEGVAAFQTDTNRVTLHTQFGEATLSITTAPDVRSLSVDSQHLVVWTASDEIQVFRINRGGIELHSHFALEGVAAVEMHQDMLFVAQGNDLHVMNLDGSTRLSIRYDDDPMHLSVAFNCLAVATSQNEIHLLDVSGKEPAVVSNPGRIKAKGAVTALGCNADGSWISVQIQKDADAAPAIYLYNTSNTSSRRVAATPPGTVLISHYWDPAEPKVMLCEYASSSADVGADQSGCVILFVTDDGGVIVADTISKEDLPGTVLGIDTPRVYAAQRGPDEISLANAVMSSFQGLEEEGPSTLSALVQFAYFVALGDLESAYVSVQLVKTPSVWETLCKLCIRQRSLVMAEKCLSNLGHTKAIKAANQARESNPEQQETILSAIATELGETDEAEQLLRDCGRYDLLSDMLQSQGRWDEAIQMAEDHDGTNIKNAHYKYAQHLESTGDESLAAKHYMQSDHLKPYLDGLVETDRLPLAEDIVVKSKDPELLSWLAQKYETLNMDTAKEFYQMAGDDLGLVRLALEENDIDTAVAIAEQSSKTEVANQVATHLESAGDIRRALSLYSGSGMYKDAIRLAKEHGMCSELVQVALDTNNQHQMMECANWLEDRGEVGKAAQLQAGGGNQSKALELIVRSDAGPDPELNRLFAAMIDDLDVNRLTDSDVSTYARRFLTLDEGDKAFAFLCKARGDRHEVFESFATLCQEQGRHRLASKCYAKTGDKLSSLKCLVRTKETKTIIAFAKAARMKEAYVIAAAYLQTLPSWSQNEQTINTIVLFLSKAKSYEKLIEVYESLAHMCIDESEDFEKALDMFTKGATYAEKIEDAYRRASMRRHFERQLYAITRFLRARKAIEHDTEPMERFCADLAEKQSSDNTAVRLEHGAKTLALKYISTRRYQDAHDLIQSMVNPTKYISRKVMEDVWIAIGKNPRDIQYLIDDGDLSTSVSSDEGSVGALDEELTVEERQVWSEFNLIK